MADPYLGEIRIFAFNYAPVGWAPCNGAILNISSNAALFALIGTYYGGNGSSTFGLPNLQGRVPVGFGQGAGLSNYVIGQAAGAETVTLLTTQVPLHTHTVNAVSGATTGASEPTNAYPATDVPVGMTAKGQTVTSYSASGATANTTLNPATLSTSGGNQPHSNIQPYLAINYCIATSGLFPPRS